MSQTAACMQWVGRKVGLAPSDPDDDARALALVLAAEEVRNSVFYNSLIPEAVRAILGKKLGGCCSSCGCCFSVVCCWRTHRASRSKLRSMLPHFEAQLVANFASSNVVTAGPTAAGVPPRCGWLVGVALSYADVALFDALRESLAFVSMDKEAELAPFPLVAECTCDDFDIILTSTSFWLRFSRLASVTATITVPHH